MQKLSRVYHPYSEWEEVKHGMWAEVDDRKSHLARAIEFTGNHKLYGSYMTRVIREWPVSCENALTDPALNKKAWVGHAACALAIGCPEDITREAWGYLTDEQRFLANKEADRAIRVWEQSYREDRGIHEPVGTALLFGWDTGSSTPQAGGVRQGSKLQGHRHVHSKERSTAARDRFRSRGVEACS